MKWYFFPFLVTLLECGALFTTRAQAPGKGDPFVKKPGAAQNDAETLITREFKVPPDVFSKLIGGRKVPSDTEFDARELLILPGVYFPEGATARYLPSASRLTVRNTEPSLAGIEAVIEGKAAGFVANGLVILEAFALARDDALAVLETERGDGARYRRVIERMGAGQARLAILTALTGKSGTRSVIESTDEVRYASEFHPSSAKGQLAAPKQFDARNVGVTLEVETIIGPDARTCDLSLVPQRTVLLGFRDLAGMAGDPGVSQPVFDFQKVVTAISLPGDEPAYLGTFTPPSEHGIAGRPADAEIWLAFIRVNLVRLGEAVAKLKSWGVNLEYSFYSLDRAAARELLIAPAPSLEGPWEKLQPLLHEKRAQFEHLVSVKTKSGQRAFVEEMRSVPHTERFDPPGTGPADAAAPGSPTQFSTRETGMSIEAEPIVGPDLITIDLNHVVKSTGWLGDLKTTGIAVQYPPQPLFETRRITTNQTVFVGKHALVGSFDSPGANGVNERADDGRTWLVFVRAGPGEP